MSREYNISWNENQRKKLNSAVRKYNNAIRRAVKSNPVAAEFLPKEVSYSELKNSITTRRALKNTINRLTRITRPDALTLVRQNDGSLVTKYERNEFNILKSVRERAKSMRAKAIRIAQPEAGRIGTLTQASLSKDTRKAQSLSAESLRRFIETQEREMNRSNVENARRYFSNYVSALYNVFGGYDEYDSTIEFIEETILRLAKADINELFGALDEAPSIKYIYDPIARDEKMRVILEYWNKYV